MQLQLASCTFHFNWEWCTWRDYTGAISVLNVDNQSFTLKGVLINSEKACDSAHSRCSYLLFPTADAISTCWGIQIASYPDIINENFVSHGAEIWLGNRHFGHVDPVKGLPPLYSGAFPLLMLILAQHLFSQPQGCQHGHPSPAANPFCSVQARVHHTKNCSFTGSK